jgi:signal transduction histidine kinase
MDVAQRDPETERHESGTELKELLRPGVLVVEGGQTGGLRLADTRAIELLGCADQSEVESLWNELRRRLEGAGLLRAVAAEATLDSEAAGTSRPLAFDWRPNGSGGVLLVHDAEVGESLVMDLRHAALLRSLAQITPAVAHDLRAPINAMVFNIEVLKETIAAAKGGDPSFRDRQLRYVGVLRDELHRLHQGIETYIAQISPRGDRDETFDLREVVGELAALLVGPARKQQARVAAAVPETPIATAGNRHLLRQALLHLAVAALAGVPRAGSLEIRLERRDGRPWLRLGSTGATATGESNEASGSPDFGIAASPHGTRAQLWAARAILAGLGGAVYASAAVGQASVYEVELKPHQGNHLSGEGVEDAPRPGG